MDPPADHSSVGLTCLACYQSSDEEEIHPPSIAAFSAVGISEEGDSQVVHQLISQQLQEDSAAQVMELALMQRADPRCLALEEINAARLSSPQAMAAYAVPFNYVAPKVKARPRLPRVPPPGDRVFPKHAPQGYSFVSGPAPLTWSETTLLIKGSTAPEPPLAVGRQVIACLFYCSPGICPRSAVAIPLSAGGIHRRPKRPPEW